VHFSPAAVAGGAWKRNRDQRQSPGFGTFLGRKVGTEATEEDCNGKCSDPLPSRRVTVRQARTPVLTNIHAAQHGSVTLGRLETPIVNRGAHDSAVPGLFPPKENLAAPFFCLVIIIDMNNLNV
jgi:hypothetical protein